MNLLRFAFGLIRDAVETQVVDEVSNIVRPPTQKEPPRESSVSAAEVEAQFARHRAAMDSNFERVTQVLNEQNALLARELRRQRTWNFVLAGGTVVAIVVAVAALLLQ